MLKLNCFQHIAQVTKPSTFDMCCVGNLRGPNSRKPIRKRLVVCTTSKNFYAALHNRKRQEHHEHHQIAGSIQVQGVSTALSQYTEP